MNIRHLTIAFAAALAAATASTAAEAAGPRERGARAVSYADLDLGRNGDGAILHRRIVGAAQDICGSPRFGAHEEAADRRRCFRNAVQHAVDRVGAPSLTRAHLARYEWAGEPKYRLAAL